MPLNKFSIAVDFQSDQLLLTFNVGTAPTELIKLLILDIYALYKMKGTDATYLRTAALDSYERRGLCQDAIEQKIAELSARYGFSITIDTELTEDESTC